MSFSFYDFVLCMISFDINILSNHFSDKIPTKFLGGVSIFMAFLTAMMWLARIIPALLNQSIPMGLEHYTTLIVQALDLGLLVPTDCLQEFY